MKKYTGKTKITQGKQGILLYSMSGNLVLKIQTMTCEVCSVCLSRLTFGLQLKQSITGDLLNVIGIIKCYAAKKHS